MKFHFEFATAGRRRRPTRRIVTPSHIVTVAPGEDGEDGKSALDALLDTPRAGALSSDVSAATKSAQSTAALRVDIYSQTDSFTLRARCRVEGAWPGWHHGGRGALRDAALRWASQARDRSACPESTESQDPVSVRNKIGRDEAAATAAHNAALNGGPNALRHARAAVRIWPEHIEYRLALARALLGTADHVSGDSDADAFAAAAAVASQSPEKVGTSTPTSAATAKELRAEAFRHAKTLVSTARRALRALRRSSPKNRPSPEAAADDGTTLLLQSRRLKALIADAYGLMGDLHKATGGTKLPHAISAYTLALKHDPERSRIRASLARCMDEVVERGPESSRGTEPEKEASAASASAAPSATSTADIESILSNHTMLARSDSLDFGCTMCGECCRHADYIFLSPVDVWRMLRAPAMRSKRKAWKDAMRARSADVATASTASSGEAGTSGKHPWERMLTDLNSALQGALQWSSKDDLPLCYLSPKRASGGRCHFSFPLFEQDGRLVAPEASLALEAQRSGDGGGQSASPSSKGPRRRRGNRGRKGEHNEADGADEKNGSDSEYEPIRPGEWDFTEEDFAAWEEEEKLRGSEEEEEEEEEEDDDDLADGEDGDDEDSDSDEVDDDEEEEEAGIPTAILNSFGRQGLGCSLGQDSMPTMCSSYPIARELTIADFWHRDDPHLHSANSEHNSYVLVNNHSCEGLFSREQKERVGGVTRLPPRTPLVSSVVSAPGDSTIPLLASTSLSSPSSADRAAAKHAWGEEEKSDAPSSAGDPRSGGTSDRYDKDDVGSRRTVDSFLKDNDLDPRWKQQDWFMTLISETSSSGVVSSFTAVPGGQALLKYFRAALATCWYGMHTDAETPQTLRLAVHETTRKIVRLAAEFLAETFPQKRENEGGASATQEGQFVASTSGLVKRRFKQLMATALC